MCPPRRPQDYLSGRLSADGALSRTQLSCRRPPPQSSVNKQSEQSILGRRCRRRRTSDRLATNRAPRTRCMCPARVRWCPARGRGCVPHSPRADDADLDSLVSHASGRSLPIAWVPPAPRRTCNISLPSGVRDSRWRSAPSCASLRHFIVHRWSGGSMLRVETNRSRDASLVADGRHERIAILSPGAADADVLWSPVGLGGWPFWQARYRLHCFSRSRRRRRPVSRPGASRL